MTTAQTEQAGRLHAMRARGETAAELAELTGWSAAEVRAALKTSTAHTGAALTSGDASGEVSGEVSGGEPSDAPGSESDEVGLES